MGFEVGVLSLRLGLGGWELGGEDLGFGFGV